MPERLLAELADRGDASELARRKDRVTDYAAELLPHLARRAEVAVLEPPEWELDVDAMARAGIQAGDRLRVEVRDREIDQLLDASSSVVEQTQHESISASSGFR